MKTPRGIIWCPHCSNPHRLNERVCGATGKTLERTLHRANGLDHPLIGTVLDGRFRVLSVIGQGGLGIVFEGENIALGREVAIKVAIAPRRAQAIERLQREAAIIAALQHPNICDIYHFGVAAEYGPFLVTQRLHGETIAECLKWQRFIRTADTIEILVQILSALHAAHSHHIVHRDVKPQNVFLAERLGCAPIAKLLDFGLAKELSSDVRRTAPGMILGTPQYMAPEQLAGHPLSPATDLFSVGVLAFEMITGHHPFAATSTAEMQTRILRDRPRPMSTADRPIPPALEAVIMRALSKDPARRHPNAYVMQQELLGAAPFCMDDEDPEPVSQTPAV